MAELVLSSKDFKALSSDTRRKIIKLLGQRNHTLSELSKKLGLSAPSVKQHMRVLVQNNLVEQIDSGHKWKYYCLSRKTKKLLDRGQQNVFIVLSSAVLGMLGLASMFFGFTAGGTLSAAQTSFVRGPAKILGESAAEAVVGAAPEAADAGAQAPVQALGTGLPGLVLLGVALIAVAVALFYYSRKR